MSPGLQVDDRGFAYAVGRRKTSVSQVWLSKGEGRVTVNRRSLNDYFPLVEQRCVCEREREGRRSEGGTHFLSDSR